MSAWQDQAGPQRHGVGRVVTGIVDNPWKFVDNLGRVVDNPCDKYHIGWASYYVELLASK